MTTAITAHLASLKQSAEAGVDFSPRTGAPCPACGRKAKSYRTLPWEGAARIRYHRCLNPSCLLHAIRQSIKSVEVDPIA